MRSWFYRIFLLLAVLVCVFNFIALVSPNGGFLDNEGVACQYPLYQPDAVEYRTGHHRSIPLL